MKVQFFHKHSFGQNFLINDFVIDQITNFINPNMGDYILEIGAGQGALTEQLINFPIFLHSLEIDRDLIGFLLANFANKQNFKLTNIDALKFDYDSILNHSEQFEAKQFKIVGNLPYNISAPLLFKLTTINLPVTYMIFMLQKEVVEKITATVNSSNYGRISVMMQYFFETSNLLTVYPDSFHPKPKVDSAIIKLVPRSNIIQTDLELFSKVVKEAFTMPRKTIKNNLKNIPTEIINKLNIDLNLRPANLSVADYVNITNALKLHS